MGSQGNHNETKRTIDDTGFLFQTNWCFFSFSTSGTHPNQFWGTKKYPSPSSLRGAASVRASDKVVVPRTPRITAFWARSTATKCPGKFTPYEGRREMEGSEGQRKKEVCLLHVWGSPGPVRPNSDHLGSALHNNLIISPPSNMGLSAKRSKLSHWHGLGVRVALGLPRFVKVTRQVVS